MKISSSSHCKALFLDRDGVINVNAPDHCYVLKWEQFQFLDGSINALKLLSTLGIPMVVVTNQQGIGKGLMSESDLANIHERMCEELSLHGVQIDAIYHCPHLATDRCDCRKPKPGMLFQAAREHCFDLKSSIFIGDSERDMMAGRAAGTRTVFVKYGSNHNNEEMKHASQNADITAETLTEAAKILIGSGIGKAHSV